MRHILLMLILCSIGCNRSEGPTAESPHDRLRELREPTGDLSAGLILEPREVNLGSLEIRSTPVNVDFVLKNETGRNVSINRIETSCGCTAASPAKGILSPGESTLISASVKIRELGPRGSRLRICSEDGMYSVSASIHWSGGSTVSVSPGSLEFGQIIRGTSKTAPVTITSPDGTSIDGWLLGVEVVPGRECSIRRLDEGDTSRISVTVSPNGTADEYRGTVKLICRQPVGEILVPIEWRTEDRVSLKPPGAFKSNVRPGAKWSQRFFLHSETAIMSIVAPEEYELVQEEIRPGLVSCKVSMQAPLSVGPFSIKVPIDVDFGADSRQELTFGVSGIVAP
jgi:hypothetical protein